MSRDRRFGPDLEPIEEDLDNSEVTMRMEVGSISSVRRRAHPTLRVVAGRDLLRFAILDPDADTLVGRDEQAQLRLVDLTVSKRHARIILEAGGDVLVHDLGSTNGTSLNGRAITKAYLRPGDHLEVGGVSMRLDMLSQDEIDHLKRVLARVESAHRDSLTGLLNRSYIEQELPTLVKRCEQSDAPLACSFIDIDKFKNINDTFGHQVGDDVLSVIARLMMLEVRDADPSVRYGGEELILFLPSSGESHACEVSERIRRSIASQDWERTAPGLRVTASFGVAQRLSGEPIKDWLRRADAALYRAKRSGRNRVERASQSVD